jgi:hypothetical protein
MAVLIPLRHRVPNPPACFTGRAHERRVLARTLPTTAVTVVVGASGVGKSALVHAVFDRELHALRERTIAVSVRGGAAHEHVAFPILRALVDSTGPRALDWTELLRAPDAMTELALDLAEEQELVVVIDDLDGVAEDELESVLGALGRYARRSRWLLIARAAPRAVVLRVRVVELGPMAEASLIAVARALRPASTIDEARAHARAAEGSAWKLVRRLHFGAGPVHELDEATRATLTALSALAIPIPRELAQKLVPDEGVDLDALVDGGLLERVPAGLRVPASLREQLPAQVARAWSAKAAELLAAERSHALHLEAMRLARGDGELLVRLVTRFADELLAEGYAPQLEAIVVDRDDASLDELRLRVALELGDRASLARARPPRSGSLAARSLWAEIALMRGAFEEGSALAEDVAAGARMGTDPVARFDAELRRAKFIGNLGRLTESLEISLALDPPDRAARARRDSFASQVASLLENVELAGSLATAAGEALDALPWPERAHVGARVARTFYNVVRYDEAAAVLDRIQDDARLSLRFHWGRMVRFTRACIALDRGDLESARAELDALAPYLGDSTLLEHVWIARAVIAAAAGDLAAHAAACAALETGTTSARAEHRRVMLAGRLLLRLAPDAPSTGGTSLFDRLGALVHLRVALHAGTRAPSAVLSELVAEPAHPEERISLRLLRAEALLCAGDAREALAAIASALREARERSFALLEAEASAVECDVLAVLGEAAALAHARTRLARHARALPSPRLDALARLHGELDVATVERLADAHATAPEAALRARALLDPRVTPGVVDALVVEARRRAGWTAPVTLEPEPLGVWRARWGWDHRARAVWLPDGRAIPLDAVPLLGRILDALVLAGGRASKEELVLGVWGERSYHPLRHDNRLQAAIRKLRRRIEDDPAKPERLVTTDDGYALAAARVAWVVTAR